MHTYEHASDLGGCLARPVALRMGYEPMAPPAKMQTVFDAGNKWEDITIDKLTERGFPVSDRQLCVYINVTDEVRVACHIDGTIEGDMDAKPPRRILEVKSMSQTVYSDFLRLGWEMGGLMERYKWQTSCYMVAMDMELALVGVNRGSDPANPEYYTIYREVPWYSREQIVTQVMLIEAFAKMGQIPTCNKPMYPCPVWYATGCQDADETDELLEAMAVQILEADDKAKATKAKADNLRTAARKQMGDRKKVRTGVATLSINAGKVSKWLDESAMSEDGIDVGKYRREKKGDPYLTVRRRAQEDRDNAATTE